MKKTSCLVVGAGIAGCTAARLLAESGWHVLVVDRRDHIGGNSYDEPNDVGITVHRYGPHIFHTREKAVWDFLCRFTEWRLYQHRVLGFVNGDLYPVPVNLDTVNRLYGLSHTAETIGDFYRSKAVKHKQIVSLRDAVTAQIGEELYELFFRNYTRKQWGVEGTELPSSIAARVPARTNRDSRYFTDPYQGMPAYGYTPMFKAMLDHPEIEVSLETDYAGLSAAIRKHPTFYSGGIDEFFGLRHGPLPYRSLRFEFKTYPTEFYQPVMVVNYPNDYDFTRITEFKHGSGETSASTTVVAEYPTDVGEPYYPLPTEAAQALYRRYAKDAADLAHVRFLGRLGSYRYMNMDQVVLEAMQCAASMGAYGQ